MASKIYLGVIGIILIAYGVACFLNPQLLERLAGISASSLDGTAELRAMYGGVQVAVGVFYLMPLLNTELLRSCLMFNVVLFAGIALARGAAIAMSYSNISNGDNLTFNLQALLFFEIPVLIIGVILLLKNN